MQESHVPNRVVGLKYQDCMNEILDLGLKSHLNFSTVEYITHDIDMNTM